MKHRILLAMTGVVVLMNFANVARADDEIGIARFVISGTRAGVMQAVADGTIFNQLNQGGLDESLEEQWPSNDPASPKDVFVNVYVKINLFIEVYTVKIQLSRSAEQTWEEAVDAGGNSKEVSLLDYEVEDLLINPGEEGPPGALELFAAAFPALSFPPGAVVVINGDGGNGNWCGPGTPWICVY